MNNPNNAAFPGQEAQPPVLNDTFQPTPAPAAVAPQPEPVVLRTDASPSLAPTPNSAGALLRQARLAQGVELETLSKNLNVPVEKLQALEADDWQRLPGTVFVRTVAASVCRQLGADSAPILALLPQSTAPSLNRAVTAQRQGGAHFQASALPATGTGAAPTRSWWGLAIVLLLAAAVAAAAFWMPAPWQERIRTIFEKSADPTASAPVVVQPAEPVVPAPVEPATADANAGADAAAADAGATAAGADATVDPNNAPAVATPAAADAAVNAPSNAPVNAAPPTTTSTTSGTTTITLPAPATR